MNEMIENEAYLIGQSNYEEIIVRLEDALKTNSSDSLIELSVPKTNFSLLELVSIIESEGYEIRLFWKNENGDSFYVAMLINSLDLKSIINTLEYRGYTILNYHNQPEYDDILKDRYDQLMKFINT
jgi:hypothetical protein